jgi:hypothetical protein
MLAFGALSLVALGACGRTTSGGPAGEDAATPAGGNLGEGGALPAGGAVGTGGGASSGGAAGTGGGASSGGVVGTGGVASSGGALGTGGAASSGGAVGTGGSLAHGGATGTGGGTARGGSIGTGGFIVGGSSTNPGGGTASAGMGGRGGAIGSGGVGGQSGVRGSGGAGGWRTGPVVSPRVPAAHRPEAASCVGVNAPPEPSGTTTMAGTCKKHADCTLGKNGKCIHGIGGSYNYYSCVYDSCGTDADCDPGKVCFCSPNDAARCLSVGNCRTDADCGGGDYSYCSPSMGMDCGGYHTIDSYHCHTPQDTCIDNSDCTGSGSASDYCNFDAYDGRWKCQVPNMMCVIG